MFRAIGRSARLSDIMKNYEQLFFFPSHIQGRLITGLYSNNVGYVLAQVERLVFCQQMAQEYTHQVHDTQGVYSGHFVYEILNSPPVPKHNLHYWNRAR